MNKINGTIKCPKCKNNIKFYVTEGILFYGHNGNTNCKHCLIDFHVSIKATQKSKPVDFKKQIAE